MGKPQVPPLRYAPVGVTKGRAVLQEEWLLKGELLKLRRTILCGWSCWNLFLAGAPGSRGSVALYRSFIARGQHCLKKGRLSLFMHHGGVNIPESGFAEKQLQFHFTEA